MTMIFFLEILTTLSFFYLIYVYAGYPLVLIALSSLFKPRGVSKKPVRPMVSLIVSCYNEEAVIREKLNNCLSLKYPTGKLEIMVVSDASTDSTDDVVKEFAENRVRLIRQSERLGKTLGLNLAVPLSQGEIIIFSDANSIYEHDAIIKLVENFGDESVGYVVGEARYSESSSAAGKSENTYWQYEILLKKMESSLHSIVGGDGAIYAIRKELYEELLVTDINDFVNPLQIIAKGYRGVYEPDAICWEDTAGSFKKEFKRKVRIVNRSFSGLMRVRSVLNPFKSGFFSFEIISHKLLRWLAPVFMIFIGLSSLILGVSGIQLFQWISGCILMFLFLACIGYVLVDRFSVWPLVYIPYYFTAVNTASLIGIYRSLTGKIQTTWDSARSN